MVKASIIRLGPNSDNMSATLLRAALALHFQRLEPSVVPAEPMDETSDTTFSITNKYFKATVTLHDIGAEKIADTKEDGVILVFDALQSNPDRPNSTSISGVTFDSLQPAHEKTEAMDGAGDLLRLCVGITLTTPSSPEELRGKNAEHEYSRRILWCLDRGYEYVEADISAEGQTRGHDERDKEGFARIVEAIQGTVWSSAVMSTTQTNELKKRYQEDRETAAVETERQKALVDIGEEENPYEPPDPTKFGGFPIKSTETQALSEGAQEVSELILDAENVGPSEMAEIKKDLEADQLFEHMEGVLREASRIREASKSGDMTDEERRDRAGDAAMALVNLMAQFGLDEEESQAGYSSDDDDSGIADGQT